MVTTLSSKLCFNVPGVFAAGHDLNVQWAVVKGVAHYAGDSTVDNERWEHFASVMAASVLANILRNPIIFDEWPNYQGKHGGLGEFFR